MFSDFTAYIKYIKAFSTLAQVDIVTLPSGYESRSQIRHGEFRIQEPESNSSRGISDPRAWAKIVTGNFGSRNRQKGYAESAFNKCGH